MLSLFLLQNCTAVVGKMPERSRPAECAEKMFHVKHFVKNLSKYAGYSDFFRPFFGKKTAKKQKNARKNPALFAVLKGIESLAHYLPHIPHNDKCGRIDVEHDLFKAENLVPPQRAHNHLPIVSRIGTGGFKKCGAPFQLLGDLSGDLLGFF